MIKIKLLLTCAMIAVSSFIFAQQNDSLKFSGENCKVNKQDKTITYTGNVKFNSSYFNFDQAEKVIIDEKTNDITIYKAKNLKFISLDEIEKTPGEKDYIVFNTRTKKLTL